MPIGTNRLHGQVTALSLLLPSSVRRPSNSLRQSEDDLLKVRRMLCGFVERGVVGDASKEEARSAVRTLVVGGLRLLCVAARLESACRGRAEETIQNNRLLRRVLTSWLRVVLRGSPLRIAALRQLRLVRAVTLPVCLACVGRGTLTTVEGAKVLSSIRTRLDAARDEIDRFFPDLGSEAVWWWYVQQKWWKWWARRPKELSRTMEWIAWSPSLELALSVLRGMWPGLDRLTYFGGAPRRMPRRACPIPARGVS